MTSQLSSCLINFEAALWVVRWPHSCEATQQLWGKIASQCPHNSHSMNYVLFCLEAILMVPHCSPDDSGGMPLVPLHFFMSATRSTGNIGNILCLFFSSQGHHQCFWLSIIQSPRSCLIFFLECCPPLYNEPNLGFRKNYVKIPK